MLWLRWTLDAVRSESGEARRRAGVKIRHSRKCSRAITALLAELQSADRDVRRIAVRALGEIAEPAVLGPLVAALSDPDFHVRGAAASALGRLGDRSAAGSLAAALSDSDSRVRLAAVHALEQLEGHAALEPLTTALSDRDYAVQRAAALALGKLEKSETAVGPLLITLGDRQRPRDVRSAAAWALGRIGAPRAVEPLAAALEVTTPYDRHFVHDGFTDTLAGALASLGDSRGVTALLAGCTGASAMAACTLAATLSHAARRLTADDLAAIASLEDMYVRTYLADWNQDGQMEADCSEAKRLARDELRNRRRSVPPDSIDGDRKPWE